MAAGATTIAHRRQRALKAEARRQGPPTQAATFGFRANLSDFASSSPQPNRLRTTEAQIRCGVAFSRLGSNPLSPPCGCSCKRRFTISVHRPCRSSCWRGWHRALFAEGREGKASLGGQLRLNHLAASPWRAPRVPTQNCKGRGRLCARSPALNVLANEVFPLTLSTCAKSSGNLR